MRPIMERLASFLSCIVKSYINNIGLEILSVNVSSINDIKLFINYFNKYPLLDVKSNYYNK